LKNLDFDARVKSILRVMDFFCFGRHLENSAEKENSDNFVMLVPFCQVAFSAAFARFYQVVR